MVVVPDGMSGPENKAVRLLVEEVRARAGIAWEVVLRWPSSAVPIIAIGPDRLLRSDTSPIRDHIPLQPTAGDAREGYRIRTLRGGNDAPAVLVAGNDARGVLFGVGRLLLAMNMSPGKVTLPEPLNLDLGAEVPAARPSARLSAQDQFLRRLGPAAVGAVHPRAGRLRHQRHRADPAPLRRRRRQPPLSPAPAGDDGRDVEALRRLRARRLDLVPGDGRRLRRSRRPSTFALREWGEVFQKLPRIDAVFVPGGDPGHTRPKVLMALLEKQAANLHRFHPNAQMWVSPQSFSREWLDEFLALLQAEPAWLGGVVFGPQVRVSLPELRKAVPVEVSDPRLP